MKKVNMKREVRKFVKQFPNNRYKSRGSFSCFYTKGKCTNGTVGCLYGQILANLGFKRELKKADTACKHEVYSAVSISELLQSIGLVQEQKALNWHSTVQSGQDSGLTWGEAVERADELCGK